MNYALKTSGAEKQKTLLRKTIKSILPVLSGEYLNLFLALLAIIVNSGANLAAPYIISHTIDTYVRTKDYHGIAMYSIILGGIFVVGLIAGYLQTIVMGGIGRRVLYRLRNSIFNKLQELPVAFFNQNKTGDLISRINNDTDKLNMFFSQALMQFIGTFFIITGAGIFLLVLNIQLGAAALVPAICVLILSQLISPWVKQKNAISLQTLGGLSSQIQENLNYFKVIIAFDRLDYFREKFNEVNQKNYDASVGAGLANNIYIPTYSAASNLAQLIVISFGIYLISTGNLTIGLLVGYILYVNNFYNPLRQLASIWSTFQLALAAFDRIFEVLSLQSDMPILEEKKDGSGCMLCFSNVSFHYPEGNDILHNINFKLKKGKTYAFVGPTGGGKTTTASLMARLYDPTQGQIFLDGRDIRGYAPAERTKKIGFILQEPFLFSGTIGENISYGNDEYQNYSQNNLAKEIETAGLSKLLNRFPQGLETKISTSGDSISLGQKQIIAFMRAVLRKPEFLILDEATANIDTVTENLLDEILNTLPKETTKIVIAHRLNTIKNADEIFFVNAGEISLAGSMEHALELLLQGKRES